MSKMGGRGDDRALNASVLSRLNKVERDLKQAKETIRRKDEEIATLRARLGSVGISRREEGGSQDMKQHVDSLRSELAEMKAFLSDYGMVWIGGPLQQQNKARKQTSATSRTHTLSTEQARMIERNIKELNSIAGEEAGKGTNAVEMLVVYKDGICFNDRPFRNFDEESARSVLRDLFDGYFPQELKYKYPEGVKLKLLNRSDETYEQASTIPSSKPAGFRTNIRQIHELQDDASKEPKEDTKESFLKKISKTVIQNGKIVQMRSDIGKDVFCECDEDVGVEKTRIHSLYTQKLDLAQLSSSEEDCCDDGFPQDSAGPQSVLQIKNEDGMKTYVLKLPYWATLKDVRRAVDKHREGEMGSGVGSGYDLRSAFPPKTYSDMEETIEEAGLVPNATLFLRSV